VSLLHRRALYHRLDLEDGVLQISQEAIELLERHLREVVDDAAERARSGGKKRITPAMMRRAINDYK